jgi:hypothetical protein
MIMQPARSRFNGVSSSGPPEVAPQSRLRARLGRESPRTGVTGLRAPATIYEKPWNEMTNLFTYNCRTDVESSLFDAPIAGIREKDSRRAGR